MGAAVAAAANGDGAPNADAGWLGCPNAGCPNGFGWDAGAGAPKGLVVVVVVVAVVFCCERTISISVSSL